MVNLVPEAEQRQLVDSVARFLSDQLPIERLRPHGRSMPQEANRWAEIAALGWFGLSLAEEHGGTGFDFGDELLLYRELGRYLLSPSILATRLAIHAAAYATDTIAVQNLLSGTWRAAVGVPRLNMRLSATNANGSVLIVDAEGADLVAVWNDDGLALFKWNAFETLVQTESMDWSSTITVGTLENVAPYLWMESRRLALPAQATELIAAMLVGNAEATRDMAVAYAKVREQFGKPIGAFQAIKHRCADMAMRSEVAWAQTLYAGLSLAEGMAMATFEIHAAKILAGNVAIKNGEANIQVHGGIGFTAEADPQLFVKRAQLFNQISGNIRYHQMRLIALDVADF